MTSVAPYLTIVRLVESTPSRIAATVFLSMTAMAVSLWMADGGTKAREILDKLDDGLRELKPALAGHWSASAS